MRTKKLLIADRESGSGPQLRSATELNVGGVKIHDDAEVEANFFNILETF